MPFDVNGSYGHTPRQQYDWRNPATRCSLGMMPINGHRSHDSGGCGVWSLIFTVFAIDKK